MANKKITVFLKEDRSVVEGGPKNRVRATIYPKTKENVSKENMTLKLEESEKSLQSNPD